MTADHKSPIKRLISRIVRAFFVDYRANWIYAPRAASVARLGEKSSVTIIGPSERALMEEDSDPKIVKALSYQRTGAIGYALICDGRLASVAHFVNREKYTHDTTWKLRAGEMSLVDLVTTESFRGHGLAPALVTTATSDILKTARDMIAFIWWSHHSSRRAFNKAGWRPIGFSIELVRSGGRVLRLHVPFPWVAGLSRRE